MCWLPTAPVNRYARCMALSDRQLLDALSRTPFVDSTELAGILGEPHATVHRTLGNLLAEGIVGRVSHGTAHLPSSQRYHLTTKGIGETAWVLGFDTPSDFVRAYPASREWLTLLIRRMDAVGHVPEFPTIPIRVEFKDTLCPNSATRPWFRERRLALGISQSKLAKLAGVHVKSVQAWESGRSAPRFNRRLLLGRLLKVPVATHAGPSLYRDQIGPSS